MEELTHSLETAPVVQRGEYEYFVHPITDGIPVVSPALLREIAGEIAQRVDFSTIDTILTAEAMGIHIATAVALETDRPFAIARKRSYGFDDEVAVHQETGYSENELYLNGLEPGQRVVIIDDVISTGSTLAALSEAVEACQATVEAIVVAIERTGDAEIPELPVPVDPLISVDVVDGRVRILERG